MKKSIRNLVVLCVGSAAALFGQTQSVTWKAELRLRSEADMRDFSNSTPANIYSLLRARLAADINPAAGVNLFLQVQDSRVLGSETAAGAFSTLANTANLDLHQGYLRLDDFLMNGLSLQAGRMEVSFGTQRMIGAVGWNNVGRSFDGVRFTSAQSFGTVDLFALNTGETTVAPGSATPAAVAYAREGGQFLGGLYATLGKMGPLALDGFVLYESNRKQTVPGTNDLSRVTVGGYGRGSAGSIWYQSEIAYQMGKVFTRDLSAYMVTGMVGLDLAKTGFTRVGVGADILSGTSTTATESNTFVPAFHTGHKFYGYMDYFVGIPAQGLHDFIGTVRYQMNETVSMDVTGHLFQLAQSSFTGKDLGTEIDAVASWKYNGYTSIQCGASVFLPGGVMKALYGATDTGLWGFAAIVVSI